MPGMLQALPGRHCSLGGSESLLQEAALGWLLSAREHSWPVLRYVTRKVDKAFTKCIFFFLLVPVFCSLNQALWNGCSGGRASQL